MNRSTNSSILKQLEEAAERTPAKAKTSPFITRSQLAERWQLSGESLKRYERRGILKPVKIAARMLRYRLADIEAIENEATLDREEVSA